MSDKKSSRRIGEKLKELRHAHNYTQSEVAMAAEVRQQTYSYYESGKRTPGAGPLYRIASYYGLAADDLMKLCIDLDENVYYDAVEISENGVKTADYLRFCNDPKYNELSPDQKKLLYYQSKLDVNDRQELTEYAEFKFERNRSKQ